MILLWASAILADLCAIILQPGRTLDSRFYYSSSEAANYLANLSAAESLRYVKTEFCDFAFIALYSAILFLTLKRLAGTATRIRFIALIPGLLDLIETSVVLLCLHGFLKLEQVPWLGMITAGKWITGVLIGAFCLRSNFALRDRG